MTSLTIGIIVTAGVLLVVWLLKPASPAANEPLTPEMVRALLDALLYQGKDRGQLAIHQKAGPTTLTFTKYVAPNDVAGICCECLLSAAGEQHFLGFGNELRIRGIRFTEPDIGHIVVDLEKDIGLGHFLASIFFERVVGVKLEQDCVGYFNERVLTVPLPGLTGVERPPS